ncbi:MAG: gas vesicle protein GvpJ [Nitrospinota bacterium]
MINAVCESKNISLAETLDRALNKGVILSGDVTISVADVDLIFVGLKVLLASVDKAEKLRCGYITAKNPGLKIEKSKPLNPGILKPSNLEIADKLGEIGSVLPEIDTHPDRIEHGLGRLVLTLVELIRQLIERQAMRRVDGGSLSEEEIERLGETLMKLEGKMKELKKVFGLKDGDLNINLGPLGDLM